METDQPIQKPSDLGPFLRFMSDLKILLSALRDNNLRSFR